MACQPISCDECCIAFKHSGGAFNKNPCQDLGGPISIYDIDDIFSPCSPGSISNLDNLFHSIGPKLSRRGHEDYRCFYIQNPNITYTLRNIIIYLNGPAKTHGTYVALGVKLQDAIQQVTVNGTSQPDQGDYFEVLVPGYSTAFKVYFDANITKWIGNFQTAIRAVDGLTEVVVTGEGFIGTTLADPTVNVIFTIDFGGIETLNDGTKGMQSANHEIGVMTITNFLAQCTAVATITDQGSPVMTTAEDLMNDEIKPPAGIVFDYYFRGNPIRVGSLTPLQYLPIWVRRTLPIVEITSGPLARSGQMAKLLDGFEINVDATYP
jgi:hypothetical protein